MIVGDRVQVIALDPVWVGEFGTVVEIVPRKEANPRVRVRSEKYPTTVLTFAWNDLKVFPQEKENG